MSNYSCSMFIIFARGTSCDFINFAVYCASVPAYLCSRAGLLEYIGQR